MWGGLFELMTNVTLMTLEMLTVNSWEVMHCQSCKHQLRRIRCWLCTGTRTMVDGRGLSWKHQLQLGGERTCNDCPIPTPPTPYPTPPPIIHLPHLPPRSTCICPAKKLCSIHPSPTKGGRVFQVERMQYVLLQSPVNRESSKNVPSWMDFCQMKGFFSRFSSFSNISGFALCYVGLLGGCDARLSK